VEWTADGTAQAEHHTLKIFACLNVEMVLSPATSSAMMETQEAMMVRKEIGF
jgi:hypothetical protein